MYNNEHLQHYGILGMRWGHRKSGRSSGPITRPHINTDHNSNSEDHEKVKKLKAKKLSEMTNAELQEFTKRLNLEKQYKELNKGETSKGMKIVKEILGNSAKQIAQTQVTKYMNKAVEELIKQASNGKGA